MINVLESTTFYYIGAAYTHRAAILGLLCIAHLTATTCMNLFL